MRSDIMFYVQESQGTFDPARKIFRAKKSRFQRNGLPDIHLTYSIKQIPIDVGLEVKTKSGRQSDSQKIFERDVLDVHGFYFIVRSVEDVINALNKVKAEVEDRIKRAGL